MVLLITITLGELVLYNRLPIAINESDNIVEYIEGAKSLCIENNQHILDHPDNAGLTIVTKATIERD